MLDRCELCQRNLAYTISIPDSYIANLGEDDDEKMLRDLKRDARTNPLQHP